MDKEIFMAHIKAVTIEYGKTVSPHKYVIAFFKVCLNLMNCNIKLRATNNNYFLLILMSWQVVVK